MEDKLTTFVAEQYNAFQSMMERRDKERKYLNYGFKEGRGQTYEDRQERLCREVFDGARIKKEDVLADVGFGSGEQDFYLARNYEFGTLHGFNIASKQVEFANHRAAKEGLAPKMVFHHFPAERMEPLKDRSVDKVLSVECAFYFDRPVFYKEAHRVLKPGGLLVLADISFSGAISFITRWTQDMRRVGTLPGNRRSWAPYFDTERVTSINAQTRSGVQNTVFQCLKYMRISHSWVENRTLLSMAFYSQITALGLLTRLIRYDLIVLKRKS